MPSNFAFDYAIHQMSPWALTPHPLNFRVHPAPQGDLLAVSLQRWGWLKSILYNEATGYVLNGHERVERARRLQRPTVPVWVINVTEAEEQRILLLFDRIGAMRETDEMALHALVEGCLAETGALPLGYTPEALQGLREAAGYHPDLDGGAYPDLNIDLATEREFTLTFTPDEHERFIQALQTLMERWGTEGTVLTLERALERVAARRLGL